MPAQAKEKFIFAHAMNTDHVFHALSERFISELKGNKEISIAYHPGGDLGRLDITVRAIDAGRRSDDPDLGVVRLRQAPSLHFSRVGCASGLCS